MSFNLSEKSNVCRAEKNFVPRTSDINHRTKEEEEETQTAIESENHIRQFKTRKLENGCKNLKTIAYII